MPDLRLPALLKRLGERPDSAVVFLHGSEAYLRDQAVHTVVELFAEPSTRDFNLDHLRGSDVTAEALASLLATPPMMADYRVVVVRDAQGLSNKAREVVEEVAAHPSAGLVLVVAATIPAGSSAKFYTRLRSTALSVEFSAVRDEDLPGWLIDYAQEAHQVEIELDAARAWAAAIGSELGVLATEVEKAVAYIGGRKRITLEDVKAIGGYIPRVDRWKWLDLVSERKFLEALRLVPDLLDAGETGVGLVLAMGGQLLKLGIAVDGGREALDRQLDPRQRWLVNKLPGQVRGWTPKRIDQAIETLLRADRLLKSAASLGERAVVEEVLIRLAADGDGFSSGRASSDGRRYPSGSEPERASSAGLR
ncbi:MAG: DNA polymerase III subunit delta [Gemmatimonadota bacterium]|jgi:DNA polymerase-3 subunit delta|nr:DNA polymerase III subunit delta [Gemmatimonadota bacterium]